MVLATLFSWPGEALSSKIYCPSVTPSLKNRCVSYFGLNVDRNFNSSCGIIMIIFFWDLYCVVQEYGMVGAGILCVPTLGYDAVIIRATLGGVGVSTLGGDIYPTLCDGYVCTTLGGSPYFIRLS